MPSGKRKILILICISLVSFPAFFSGGRSPYVVEIATLLMFALAATLTFLPQARRPSMKKSIVYITALFIFFNILSLVYSISPFHSLLSFFNLAAGVALFVFAANYAFEKFDLEVILKSLAFSAFLVSLVGFFYYMGSGLSRLASTFYWPNPFAGYLLLVAPISVYYHLKEKKLIWLIIFSIELAALFFTGSRGAYLSLLFACLTGAPFIYARFKESRKQVLNIALVLSVFFLFVFAAAHSMSFLDRYKHAGEDLDLSSKIRMNYWEGAIRIWREHPYFGIGSDTFFLFYPRLQKDILSSGIYPHNWALEMLSENGIFVFLAFAALSGLVLYKAVAAKDDDGLKVFLAVGLAGSLAHNLLDFDWHFFANSIIFWFYAGLAVRSGAGAEIVSKEKYRWFKIAAAALIMAFVAIKTAAVIYEKINFDKGMAASNLGDLEQAQKYLKQSDVIRINPGYFKKSVENLFAIALAETDPSKRKAGLDEVGRQADSLIRMDRENHANMFLRGNIAASEDRWDEAAFYYGAAILRDRINHPEYYYNLALIKIKQGDPGGAKKMIDDMLPYYSPSLIHDREMSIFNDQPLASSLERKASELYLLRAALSLGEKDREKAKELALAALKIDPDNPRANQFINNLK